GNYSDYRVYEESAPKETASSEKESKPKNDWKTSNEEKKLTYNEQKEYKKLERDISKLEKEKEKLQQEFLKELTEEEIKNKSIDLQKLEDSIEEKTERWFDLLAKMEE
uniref:ABC transporter C-terminal domain-containing protein n=1 Tax=Mesonia mobilis TaxID=369791 RepID=UPI0026F2791A